jgi:uncharacterized protein YdhG (YjbR/CyaY superfamily)
MQKNNYNAIDTYILHFPENVQIILKSLRKTISESAPNAKETLKYGIPTFTLNGNLVHFGAYKNHIGFYPTPSGIEAFKKEISAYKNAKGSVQFPIKEPIPLALITKIVKFRVQENLKKTSL